jgi:RHS repeat-associated protein
MKQHKKVSYNGGILKRHDEESKRSVFKRFMAGETMAALVRETGVNKETYTFDRYGNRRFDEGQTTTLPRNCGTPQNPTICPEDVARLNPEINPANNRLSSPGWQYDAAGNTVRDAESRRFIYDGENKQVKVETVDANGNPTATIGQYFFDGDGKRIKKIVPATGEVTVFVYDASGKSIAEYSTVVEPVETAKVAYLTADHLGSPRINTDRDGNVTSRRDFHPFGEEIYTAQRTTGLSYDADNIRKQFTGYERDDETHLDFAQARMHSYNLGRFTSPDPLLSSGRTESPQTWNRFVYVLGNPLRFVDPLGLFEWSEELGGSTTSSDFEAQLGALRSSRKGKSKEEKKRINAQIDRIKQILSRRTSVLNGMKAAREASRNLSGSERSAVNSAISAYGAEHEANGVVIAVGDETQSGQAIAGIDNNRVVVAIRPDQFKSDTLFLTLAHEGSHVLDGQDEIFSFGTQESCLCMGCQVSGSDIRSSISARDTELRAYQVSFWTAKGSNFSKSLGIGGINFYQPGWREIDVRVLDQALGVIGRGPNDQAGRNPANWDISGRWR